MRTQAWQGWCGVVAAHLAVAMMAAADDAARAVPVSPANILLIVADDLGYGDLGCYGGSGARTPRIDALAAEGLRFTQFRVNPLCAPTRASLLSGLYSLETGMWRGPSRQERADGNDRELHADLRLLPQLLQAAGYATGMFGKWHLGYASPNLPNDRGFQEFVGFTGGSHPYDAVRGAPVLRNDQTLEDGRHLTDLFTEEALAFIETHRARPFFCYVPFNAVHGPLWSAERERTSAKREWLARLEERGIDLPRRDYYATLEHLDDSIGKLLAALRRLGLEQRTLVVFLSDNGALEDKYPGDNGPLRGQKGEVYEGGIRVPAVLRWPGVVRQARCRTRRRCASICSPPVWTRRESACPSGTGGMRSTASACWRTRAAAARPGCPTGTCSGTYGASWLPITVDGSSWERSTTTGGGSRKRCRRSKRRSSSCITCRTTSPNRRTGRWTSLRSTPT
jgi:arylsulfatase A